jgi:6-carboxyhexanoate--CoA ligase
MVSIRMRASRRVWDKNAARRGGDKVCREVHISGAEGLFCGDDVKNMVDEYLRRAMSHSRGRPERIDITIERVAERPGLICALPVRTLRCGSQQTAEKHIRMMLAATGVSERAVNNGIGVVFSDDAMRGAAIIEAGTGSRVEPDKKRGVRASRLGVSKGAASSLRRSLGREGINNDTVFEALVLASKVASCPSVVAELCVSDDPDYTTGYVASRALGYVRIPRIKRKGARKGGRVFFVDDGAEMGRVTEYLEEKPVLVNRVSECRGICSIYEVIGKHHI